MKKIIFSLLILSAIILTGCSEESATDFNTTETTAGNIEAMTARSAVWNGEIGVDDNGVYKITADVNVLKADLEDMLRKEGNATTIQSVQIVKKVATNDPNDAAYVLVGTDNNRISIGIWLKRQNHQFTMDGGFTSSTSCKGCAQGCNLSYLLIDGKKVAYCNENGCIYDCTKTESTL